MKLPAGVFARVAATAGRVALVCCVALAGQAAAQNDARVEAQGERVVSGVVVTPRGEVVPGVTVVARGAAGERRAETDGEGAFRLGAPRGPLVLSFEGRGIAPAELTLAAGERAESLRVRVTFVVPPVHESVVIEATALDPSLDRRNAAVYEGTLFSRDDQLLQTLAAGISAGQHEGGGKSLEVRRFGFNLDHGGVGGGLKVLVDNVQQNHSTQGHGQGYLGQLKSLTPELVRDVDILNGPFSAQYGDFSGLGVVHVRLKESLPDQLTLRMQGGSFGAFRGFVASSPQLKEADAFVAYEASRTDGPFLNPLRYRRDNVTANYTRRRNERDAWGLKFNFGRNDFVSSGQIPLDEVAAGRLDRFGFIDPDNGGRVRAGTVGVYYRRELASGGSFKLDGFVARALFDLYSNFTFFLADETRGDEIQQHDSRLQQGANAQYLRPYKIAGLQSLFTAGGNYHDNQINVGLSRTVARAPFEAVTSAHARVTNGGLYLQNGVELLHGHLRVEGGLRLDLFRFDVRDRLDPAASGRHGAGLLQPKFSVAYTPSDKLPATLYLNYGRGISSQDARGVARRPAAPKVSTTDFYQLGTAHNLKRVSLSTDFFLIDRSNEQVYIPDDGSFEFRGPSRSYGFELKTSARLARQLTFNGGLTKVSNAFFRGTAPRLYVDGAPHLVANAALTLSGLRGFDASLGYRHASGYRLDGEDARVRAAGLDVLDLSLTKRLTRAINLNLSADNLTNKRYYETQNFFESRLRPGEPAAERVHATPGYPLGVTVGVTVRLFGKD